MVLTFPEGTNGFVVYCDFSTVVSGCVQMQNGKVIAYDSMKLNFMRRIILPIILS